MRQKLGSIASFLAIAFLCSCGGGAGGGGSGGGSDASVTVSPASVVLAPLGQRQFDASVSGLADDSVTWEVVGGSANGEITAAGLYTAPGGVGFFQVRATSVENPAVSGLADVTVTVGAAFEDIDEITGTVTITIDDSISYDFSHGEGLDYRADENWDQDVTYDDFLLHGSGELEDGVFEWNTHRYETTNVTGSYSYSDDWYRRPSGTHAQHTLNSAGMQSVTVECYFNLTIDTATMSGTIHFDGVGLDGTHYWEDLESGDYQDESMIVDTWGCKAENIPITVSSTGHITGSRTGVPILVYEDPDRYIEATLTWDFEIRN